MSRARRYRSAPARSGLVVAPEQLTLDFSERQDLVRCEAIIERGLATFIEVGGALLHIRDHRLYRETHRTFEDYCWQRWNLKRPRAYELMEAAEVAGGMSEISDIPVTRESHAAELASLRDEPEAMAEAWSDAHDATGGQPTAADVRDAVRRRQMGVHYSRETPEWETPQDLFDVLDAEFGFDLDVCATPQVAKCARYFTPADDGLAQEWSGVCWMNPPYGDEIPRWVAKAADAGRRGATVVCLVPARVDTGWWWDHCRYGEVRFLRGRLRFGGAQTGAPFPSAVVIFGRPTAVHWWELGASPKSPREV